MNAATRSGGLKHSIARFWNERNKREQNMLTAAIIIATLGLVYALLLDPAMSGREDLEKRLPALRQQAAEVQALAKEASAEQPAANLPPPQQMTRENLEASLSRNGLKVENLSVTGELAKAQFSAVSFAALVGWLSDMQRNSRINVVDANIEAQSQADSVNASLTLRQQRGETTQ